MRNEKIISLCKGAGAEYMRNMKVLERRCSAALFAVLVIALAFASTAMAESDPVTAKFVKKGGRELVVSINADQPVPGSIIFTMQLPKGIILEKSEPQPGKYDSGKGEVKWLLRGLSPGNHEIKLRFSENVEGNALHAEIRYLNSSTGKLSILPVK